MTHIATNDNSLPDAQEFIIDRVFVGDCHPIMTSATSLVEIDTLNI